MEAEQSGFRELVGKVPFSWWVAVPPVLVHALVLAFSRRVWTHMVETHSRSGATSMTVDAHLHLLLLAIGLGGYAVVAFWQYGISFGWHPGMRDPSVGEVAVAKGLVRVLFLGLVYASAYTLLRDYVFH
jgi:hypothetical protein